MLIQREKVKSSTTLSVIHQLLFITYQLPVGADCRHLPFVRYALTKTITKL